MESTTIIQKGKGEVFDVFGPTIELLTPPAATNNVYCVMHGVIPAGISVPLHSHPDDESFYILSGVVQALLSEGNNYNDNYKWIELKPGDFIHVPANTRHAWKNISGAAVEGLITTTPRLGRFFLETGRRVEDGKTLLPPTPEQLQYFMQVADKYHHWLGDPEENAAVGISVLP